MIARSVGTGNLCVTEHSPLYGYMLSDPGSSTHTNPSFWVCLAHVYPLFSGWPFLYSQYSLLMILPQCVSSPGSSTSSPAFSDYLYNLHCIHGLTSVATSSHSLHIIVNLLLSASIGNVGLIQPSCSRFSSPPYPTHVMSGTGWYNLNHERS